MKTCADKTQKSKSQSMANALPEKQSGVESIFQFADNRPMTIAQRKLQEMENNSPRAMQLRALKEVANNNSAQQWRSIQKKENETGLPDNLKSGIENLSGYSMDDVKVHYNSEKPAQLQAHAYAQGIDIHLASGQEKHLPHEAWHVVQQKQGRVSPTLQLQGTVPVNDDAGLEQEADEMGGKALRATTSGDGPLASAHLQHQGVLQRKIRIKDSERELKDADGSEIAAATHDEFLRFYEDEKEVQDHLVAKNQVTVGLVKNIAMWYRLPPEIASSMFVFGESHAGVTGSKLKAESNFKKPILNEAITGWTAGKDDITADKATQSGAEPSTKNAGVDENGAKLYRAIQYVRWSTERALRAAGSRGASSEASSGTSLPHIAMGKDHTRITKDGSYRLVVDDGSGKGELWKPQEKQAATKYDTASESSDAISGLFPLVFGDKDLDVAYNGLDAAWKDYCFKSWRYRKTVEARVAEMKRVLDILERAAHKCVSEQYVRDFVAERSRVDHSPVLSDPNILRSNDPINADFYRDEYMLQRIVEAKKTGKYAFANIGDAHRKRIALRLEKAGIPVISAEKFYGTMTKTAIDTADIKKKNVVKHEKRIKRLTLWTEAAWKEYPKLEQFHMNALNNHDFGEFVIKGIVTKWEKGDVAAARGFHNKAVLIQFYRDFKECYPNGEQYLNDLSFAQIGEFIVEGEIAALEEM